MTFLMTLLSVEAKKKEEEEKEGEGTSSHEKKNRGEIPPGGIEPPCCKEECFWLTLPVSFVVAKHTV